MAQYLTRLPTQVVRLTFSTRSQTQLRGICPQCAHRLPSANTRSFTTTRRRDGNAMQMGARTNVDSKLPKQQSMKSQMKNASRQQIGTDLGKLPQTFILPPESQLPPWTKLKRFKIHWLQFKTAVKDWGSLVIMLKWEAKRDPLTNKTMYKPLELDTRIEIAKKLHEEFHVALGDGDLKRLQPICCEGLMSKARTRIDQRRSLRSNREPWVLGGYLGLHYPTWLNRWPLSALLPKTPARVVADRIAPLPFADTYIRQCTVQIDSVQNYRLAKMESLQSRRHLNYVVIQKMTTKGEEGPWKLWGLTEPCTMEEIDNMLSGKAKDTGTTLAERIQEKLSGFTGM